jgi:transposase InsO family protein
LPNLLNRKFKQNILREVLFTDITYLFCNNRNKKAYLSTIKDASTNEVSAYNVSVSSALYIVTDTIVKLKESKRVKFPHNAFVHSDQENRIYLWYGSPLIILNPL